MSCRRKKIVTYAYVPHGSLAKRVFGEDSRLVAQREGGGRGAVSPVFRSICVWALMSNRARHLVCKVRTNLLLGVVWGRLGKGEGVVTRWRNAPTVPARY